ncbi:unnamed protein product [Clonostachys rosea f. rosea IK726]|uniref:Uncharacterized protein n=1 Tax=Clonostachys rosea f. rosea IK726 TaxID=1349383 RepID=A0ACA9U535_BIOOC|nr:unnamed protein product [Clonostachys rosea f. rosea IK726]
MPSLFRSGLWLLAAKASNAFDIIPQFPDPMATSVPYLEERDVDSMVGVFITNGQYQTMYCNPGRTPIDVSGRVLCSSPGLDPPNASTPVTACSDSFALFGTTSVACSYPTTCGSMRLLLSTDAASTETWIACGSALPATIYRNPPPITSGATTTTSSSSTMTSTTSTTSTSPPPPPSSSSSQAWIAGPVIGGVVGLALIGFLVWWLMRRRRRRAQAQHPVSQVAQTSEVPKTGSPAITSQWSSPAPTYGSPHNGYAPTSPTGTAVPPYPSQYPPPGPGSPSQMSSYGQGPSPVHGVSPPPGQYAPQHQWQAPAPIHEMPTQNYDGPAELSGNTGSAGSGPFEAPPSSK